MAAAVIVATNISRRWSGIGFVIFTASSIAWIVGAMLDGENALLSQNLVLLVINVWGVYRYLLSGNGMRRPAAQEG